MKSPKTTGTSDGFFIPHQFAEGGSVDLIYMQAMEVIGDLASQQFAIGLARLFEATPALAGFVLRLDADNEEYSLCAESIELSAEAADDTRLIDIKNAIAQFIDHSVSALIYQQLDGRRITRESVAAASVSSLRPLSASGRPRGLGIDEAGIEFAGITLAFLRDAETPGYIRMLDTKGDESLFLDTAIAHANPAHVIRIFIDLFRSLTRVEYQDLDRGPDRVGQQGLAEVA